MRLAILISDFVICSWEFQRNAEEMPSAIELANGFQAVGIVETAIAMKGKLAPLALAPLAMKKTTLIRSTPTQRPTKMV